MARIDIRLKPGERGLLAGQSGSGKTYAAAWMLRHTEQRAVIFDTKHEPVLTQIAEPDSEDATTVVASKAALKRELKNTRTGADYIVVRPSIDELAEPFAVDEYLTEIYHTSTDVYVYIDEAYQLHRGGQAGPGLIGLLTRGRARGITTLVATQRPAWLSRFALTEANRFYIYHLVDRKDWARLSDVIPNIPKEGIEFEPYQFAYYKMGDKTWKKMKPLPAIADLGYTPQASTKPRRKWL